MSREKSRSGGQILLRFLFLLYSAVMLWLLFGQRMDRNVFYGVFSAPPALEEYWETVKANCNFTPLHTVKQYLHILEHSADSALVMHAIVNLAGNVILFIPLGIFLPGIFEKKAGFSRFILSVIFWIAAVEILQLVTLLGSCDVDDLILNLAGALIGYIIYGISRIPQ